MQPRPFAYDELTPLEQCIADFMAKQQRKTCRQQKKNEPKKEYADA